MKQSSVFLVVSRLANVAITLVYFFLHNKHLRSLFYGKHIIVVKQLCKN